MTPITDRYFCNSIYTLEKLVSIPTVSDQSSPDYSMESMIKAANFVKNKLAGFDFNVYCERIDQSAPFVIAEKIVDKKKPTVLLSAHYDVHPVDRNHWNTNPFNLVERGGRLYGRGVCGDKGDIAAILTAVNVFHGSKKGFPVNIKILFEGEEKYDSTHLKSLLMQEAKYLNTKALLVIDGMNQSLKKSPRSILTRDIINVNVGVEDPNTNVHTHNESQSGNVLRKSINNLISSLYMVGQQK